MANGYRMKITIQIDAASDSDTGCPIMDDHQPGLIQVREMRPNHLNEIEKGFLGRAFIVHHEQRPGAVNQFSVFGFQGQ